MQENNHYTLPTEEKESELDLYELFSYFLKKWPVILIGLLVGMILSGAVTLFFMTPKYTATSKIYMVSSSTDSVVDLTDLNIGTSLSSDYEELLMTRPILEEVIKDNNLKYSYEDISEMVSINTITDTRILVIHATSTDPKEAKNIANALAKKAVKELPKLMDTSKPNIAEAAIIPKEKSSPSILKNTLLGGLIGIILVMGFYTFLFIRDDTLNSSEDVEKAFGVMPLAVVPEGNLNAMQLQDTSRVQD